jgi:hypothetical protein
MRILFISLCVSIFFSEVSYSNAAPVVIASMSNQQNTHKQKGKTIEGVLQGKRYKVLCFDMYNSSILVYDKQNKCILSIEYETRYVPKYKGRWTREYSDEYNQIWDDLLNKNKEEKTQ